MVPARSVPIPSPDREDFLPAPFYADGWSKEQLPHAQALWDFHRALARPTVSSMASSTSSAPLPAAFFDEERDRLMAGRPLRAVPEAVANRALAACEAGGSPREWLARQASAARIWAGPARFPDARAVNACIAEWACPHARLLARLAGVSGSWQLEYVDEFARGFFWTGRLAALKRDAAEGRFFIPETDLAQHGVSREQLAEGRVDESMKRLLWKQTIRARNAFALAEPLALELPRRKAAAFKRQWLGALEALHEIRRREYDVWTRPIALSARSRMQVRLQARFGRTTFRSRG